MKELFYLIKRNCLIYLRDRSAVFFSVLSMLIVLMLMVVFLGSMNTENVINIIEEYGGRMATDTDKSNASYLVQIWTLAGILVVNAVTVTLTVLGNMVQDETRKKIMAFYVTPVRRIKLVLGYILSAWIIGIFMCILTLAAGELYFISKGYGALPIVSICKLLGMIICNTFTFSALGYLIALFVHSDSAWSGMLTIIGTLVGFVGGIYLPMGQLTDGVQKILKCLPVLHGASMMRVVCTSDIIEKTFAGMPNELISVYQDKMGIMVYVSGNVLEIKQQIFILFGYALAAIALAAVITKNRKLRDR